MNKEPESTEPSETEPAPMMPRGFPWLTLLVLLLPASLVFLGLHKEHEPFSVVCSDDGWYAPVSALGHVYDWAAYRTEAEARDMADRWRWRATSEVESAPEPPAIKRKWHKCE